MSRRRAASRRSPTLTISYRSNTVFCVKRTGIELSVDLVLDVTVSAVRRPPTSAIACTTRCRSLDARCATAECASARWGSSSRIKVASCSTPRTIRVSVRLTSKHLTFLGAIVHVLRRTKGGTLTPMQWYKLAVSIVYFETGGVTHTADEEERMFPRLRASHVEAHSAIQCIAALERDHRRTRPAPLCGGRSRPAMADKRCAGVEGPSAAAEIVGRSRRRATRSLPTLSPVRPN
jgi:hypothetical protein